MPKDTPMLGEGRLCASPASKLLPSLFCFPTPHNCSRCEHHVLV